MSYILRVIFILAALSIYSNAYATSYFVKPSSQGGNDNNTGLSDAQAWATVTKVNGFTFAKGDDVYFKCGGTWSGKILLPKLSGSSTDRAILGAYYGSGTIGVSGAKPIIDGAPTGSGNSKFGTVPDYTDVKENYKGLIHFIKRDYVTVQDIQSQWSGGIGIKNVDAQYFTVKNCTVLSSYRNGISATNGSIAVVGCVFEYNYTDDTSRQQLLNAGYGAAIVMSGGDPDPIGYNNTMRYNYVKNARGEGIEYIKGIKDSVIEYNIVINSQSGNIYLSQKIQNCIVRYNLVYGYKGAWAKSATGIGIDDEPETRPPYYAYAESEKNKIYGNFVANSSKGVHLGTLHSDAVIKDTEVYNNTFVDCGYGVYVNASHGGPWENSFVKNNIFWCTGTASACTLANVPTSHPGLTFDYNLWSAQPAAGARGTHDLAYAAPKLSKTTGWNTITVDQLTGSEFALQSSSPAINAGTNVGAGFKMILNAASTDFKTQAFTLVDQSSGWEVGGSAYSSSAPPTVPTLTCSAVDDDSVSCSWGAITGAASYKLGYKVSPGTCSTTGLTEITGITGTSQTITGLSPNTTYCVYARTHFTSGDSDYSTVSQVTTLPATGTLTCTAINAQRSDCTWESVTGATSYKLGYKVNPGTCSTTGLTEITGITGTSQTVQNLAANTSYCFYMRSTSGSTDSEYSAVSSPTTPAVSADILEHVVSSLGITGFTITANGTATGGVVGDSIRLYDNDSTTSPSDYHSQIDRTISSMPASYTVQWKGTLTDYVSAYATTAPSTFMGTWMYNGNYGNAIRFASDGVRVKISDNTFPLVSSTSSYIDASEHVWSYSFNGATRQLVLKRDGATVATVANAGYGSASSGPFGFQSNGKSTDISDFSMKWVQIGSGVGDIPEPVSTIPPGVLELKLN